MMTAQDPKVDADSIRREFAAYTKRTSQNPRRKSRIGFTEAGDAGLDLSWHDMLADQESPFAGAILVTKGCYAPFCKVVLDLHQQGIPLEVHAGCTGWGGTPIEPHVRPYQVQLAQVRALIDAGFPQSRVVLRIDPIFPKTEGIRRVGLVIDEAFRLGLLPACRVRYSVFDQYPHVVTRLAALGQPPVYPDGNKHAPQSAFDQLAEFLGNYPLTFESCAEDRMPDSCGRATFTRKGCLSHDDFVIMGLEALERDGTNNQHRYGCLCNSAKAEMLTNRRPCGHGCVYCYWRDR